MTITYEKITNHYGTILCRTNEDGTTTFIPIDEANSDYQAYLNKDTLVTESAPTAQQGVALLIQPPFGVGFFLPRRG